MMQQRITNPQVAEAATKGWWTNRFEELQISFVLAFALSRIATYRSVDRY
tara:strand:+ start:365 stop:514 length:150 start_codon:yes stop_codon:yes gene_type:complete